jgi:hypothetical protein
MSKANNYISPTEISTVARAKQTENIFFRKELKKMNK